MAWPLRGHSGTSVPVPYDTKLMTTTIADELGWDACRDLFPTMPSSAATLSAARWLDTNQQISNTPSQCSSFNSISPDDAAQMARLHVLEHGLKPGVDPVMHTQWKSKTFMHQARRDQQSHMAKMATLFKYQSQTIPTPSNQMVLLALKGFKQSLDPTSQKIWDMKMLGYSQTTIANDLGVNKSSISKRVAKWPALLTEWVTLQTSLMGVMG